MKLRYYKDPTKYVVADYWEQKLKLSYKGLKPYADNEIFLEQRPSGWFIGFFPGARTDGVTGWFDNKFLLKASFGHDILCRLIELGAIPEACNPIIDHEFELMILENNKNYPIWLGGPIVKIARARLARRGTNLVDSKEGKYEPEIFELL